MLLGRVMKSLVVGTVVLGLGLIAENGQAAQLELAGRLGYQLATGKFAEVPPEQATTDGLQVSDSVAGEIPIGFELGIRIIPMLALGAYVDFAPGVLSSNVRDDCDALDHDCAAFGFHMGLMAHLHFLPHGAIDPWVGVGVGGEGLALGEGNGTTEIIVAFGGVEFPLRAGVDFKLSERVALGPYIGYTFGTFSSATLSCEGPGCTFSEMEGDIDETAPHGWFGFGAKVTLLAF